MKINRVSSLLALLIVLALGCSCERIDNKAVPNFIVRISLDNHALWNTYGVAGVGDYRIFNREKRIPSNFPYNVNTYTGFGGVLLMMGINGPMAYDLCCPVEASQSIILSINSENFEAVCPKCGSCYNPLTGDGGPLRGVAINTRVGMRQYHVTPSGGGYVIHN